MANSWHLLAEGDDGLLIPSMAAEAIIRSCLNGKEPEPGARPATAELELEDYAPLFAEREIYTGPWTNDSVTKSTPLYRRLLGDAFQRLAQPIQRLHDLDGARRFEGRAAVQRGTGVLARVVAWLIGFPRSGTDIPVGVDFELKGEREIWRRNFAGKTFSSTQEEGRGRYRRLMVERFGLAKFGFALVEDNGNLLLILRRWSVFGIPLPPVLGPQGNTYEHAENDRFNFSVEIKLPIFGLVVRYNGWLQRKR